MRYAAVLTIAGRPARHVVELWVEDGPEAKGKGRTSVAPPELVEALEGSPYAARLSTAGVFLANRRLVPEPNLRAPWVEAPDVAAVAWDELVTDKSVQVNVRVPSRTVARWKAAAAAEGSDFSAWLRRAGDAHAARTSSPAGGAR